MSTKGALATIDDSAILERIAAGEITRNIAAELGVAKQSLRERLLKHPRYREAIAAQAESLVEGATAECMEMDRDVDMPAIARTRLKLDAAHKWAAARDPATWAPKGMQINIGAGSQVHIGDVLASTAQSLLAKLNEGAEGVTMGVTEQSAADDTVTHPDVTP